MSGVARLGFRVRSLSCSCSPFVFLWRSLGLCVGLVGFSLAFVLLLGPVGPLVFGRGVGRARASDFLFVVLAPFVFLFAGSCLFLYINYVMH